MITELTAEQEALIPVYREKWRAIALSTERINHQKATKAVKATYELIGKQLPELIFFNSPFSATQYLLEYQSRLENPLAIQTWELLIIEQGIHLSYQLEDMMNLEMQLRKLFQSQLKDELTFPLLAQLTKQVGINVFALSASSRIQPTDWLHSVAWFDFCIHALKCTQEQEKWKSTQLIVSECGFTFLFENLCLICDRPTKLSFDDQGRLHAEGEPAIEFADGFCVYAHHGELITEPT
jgi:hypothetical protein